jgi:spoIIIJ-associated protein
MHPIEFEAKTVEEAIALACKQLQTTENNLGIEILEQTPGKIRSIFSGRKAKIRAELKSSMADGNEPAGDSLQSFKILLERIIKEIDPAARLEILQQDGETVFNIIGDGSGIFIGKKGQTLEALQYLLSKIRMRQSADMPHIIVDSEGYRSRHIKNLVGLAIRLSEKAKKKGGPVSTNPLNAADRRIIHMALKKDSELTTWSKGEGGMRKVIIAPRQ